MYKSVEQAELTEAATLEYSLFSQLYETHWSMLYSIAYRKTGNKEEAQDIVQDLFVSLWQQKKHSYINFEIKFYLLKGLRNRLINHRRNKSLQAKHFQLFADTLSCEDLEMLNQLSVQELKEQIEKEIRLLPQGMRDIFVLSREQQLSTAEIAEKLNISPQTVKNQVSSALKRLRLGLKDYPVDYPLMIILYLISNK